MENPTTQLSRTCNACGIEKPLSAFLQLAETRNPTYGKICSTCRQTGKTVKSTTTIIDEERDTEPSGIRIRGKEKIFRDAKHEEKRRTLKDLYLKEDIKKQEDTGKVINKTNLKEASEKKHRDFYIGSQQHLGLLGKKKPETQKSAEAQKKLQTMLNTRVAVEHHKETLTTKQQQHTETIKTIQKDVERKTSTDFNNLFHAIEPGKIEMQGELKRFFTWLGNNAPIVRTLTQGKGFANPTDSSAENKTEEPSHRHRT